MRRPAASHVWPLPRAARAASCSKRPTTCRTSMQRASSTCTRLGDASLATHTPASAWRHARTPTRAAPRAWRLPNGWLVRRSVAKPTTAARYRHRESVPSAEQLQASCSAVESASGERGAGRAASCSSGPLCAFQPKSGAEAAASISKMQIVPLPHASQRKRSCSGAAHAMALHAGGVSVRRRLTTGAKAMASSVSLRVRCNCASERSESLRPRARRWPPSSADARRPVTRTTRAGAWRSSSCSIVSSRSTMAANEGRASGAVCQQSQMRRQNSSGQPSSAGGGEGRRPLAISRRSWCCSMGTAPEESGRRNSS
mmetsp:Transcript_4400/g.15462  ORF Transcript_4400/g.15462 Transcript_4400/m.15462 type:complete len:314 (+) Transcript_4400:212-1153(+)